MCKNEPTKIGSLLFSVFIGDAQKIVSGNFEKTAKCNDIFHAGFIFTALNIGNLSLCHVHGFAQLGLI